MSHSAHVGRGTGPMPMLPRRVRSLATRLVMLGLGQLVLLAATAIIIFIAEGPHDEAYPEDKLTGETVARLEAMIDQPAALTDALDGLRLQRVEISLYDGQRQLLASNVDPPLAIPPRPPWRGHRDDHGGPPPAGDDRGGPPPPPPSGAAPGEPPPGPPDFDNATAMRSRWIAARHRLILPFHIHGARGVLVARGVHGEPPGLTGPLLVLVGGVVILVIGALLTARWIVQPIDRLARTARALGSGDLSARSRLDRDDEIGDLGRRFDDMAERISSLLVTEKELLANVAHELRTPLTRIGVALDLANEGDAEAARASIVEIAVDVSELETIVDDILTAMRFEIAPGKGPAQLPLRRAVVPAEEIATAAAERLRVRHSNRPLEVEVAADLPGIYVDPVLFRRVVDNLLENAHKYTPDRDAPITLSVSRSGDDVVFEVRDRGVGISGDDLPKIFTAFFRGERSRSRETGGVGLGLTLARRIVEAHDGMIDVSSTVNVGTAVRVSVPAQA